MLALSAVNAKNNKAGYMHCNLFVHDMLVQNGMNPTDIALNAGTWGKPNAVNQRIINSGGWKQLGSGEFPSRGDIAAAAYRFPNGATGHMGIMTSRYGIIYAGGQNDYVVLSDIRYLPSYLKFIYYRYYGN